MTRTKLLFATVPLLLLSCRPNDSGDEGGFKGDLVTESDSTYCGGREAIYTNLTGFNQNLHVRLTNGCHRLPSESTFAGSAKLRVLDSAGQVVNGQELTASFNGTQRATVSVPGKGRIEVECGQREDRGRCPWSYSYSP